MQIVMLARVSGAVLGASLIFSLLPSANAQDFGPQQRITGAVINPSDVFAADLDGDGDLDVLASTGSAFDDHVAWYENLGGGSFGPQRLLSTGTFFRQTVFATDLDGDGDLDVLSASDSSNSVDVDMVGWYENLGGGSFSQQQTISTAVDRTRSARAADLDGDGDMDVVSASLGDDKVAWYENLGAGVFGTQVVISTAVEGAVDVFATDLDGDGDVDLLSASRTDDEVVWFENLGAGSFGSKRVITTAVDGPWSVYAVDLDGDGDPDVLSASGLDDKIAWYENMGGGVFGSQQVISLTPQGPIFVYATDLDGDGDADVLSNSEVGVGLVWHENLGAGSFGPMQVVSTAGPSFCSAYAADLDGDGDDDVLAASSDSGGENIAWFENYSAIGVRYCSPTIPNSTGAAGVLDVGGSTSLSLNDVTLTARSLPTYSFGYFIASRTQGYVFPVGNSQGAICVAGQVGRYVGPGQIQSSGIAGALSLSIDLNALPTPGGPVMAVSGETWNFQAWHRDANPMATSNFTDAVGVTFQ